MRSGTGYMKGFHRQRYTTGPAPGHHVLSSLAMCWRCSSTKCGVHSPRVCSVVTRTTGVRLERSPSPTHQHPYRVFKQLPLTDTSVSVIKSRAWAEGHYAVVLCQHSPKAIKGEDPRNNEVGAWLETGRTRPRVTRVLDCLPNVNTVISFFSL